MEHQQPDGTITPPTAIESTELKVGDLRPPDTPAMPMQRLTLDEADLLRATRSFKESKELPEWFLEALNNEAFYFSEFIIKNCPEGRERSQALGQINAVVVWAKWAGVRG